MVALGCLGAFFIKDVGLRASASYTKLQAGLGVCGGVLVVAAGSGFFAHITN